MNYHRSDDNPDQFAGTHFIVRTGRFGEEHRCDRCGKLIEDDTDARTYCPETLDPDGDR